MSSFSMFLVNKSVRKRFLKLRTNAYNLLEMASPKNLLFYLSIYKMEKQRTCRVGV